MNIFNRISNQNEQDAALTLELLRLQQLEVVIWTVLLFGVLWLAFYVWAIWRCVKVLKNQHHSIWITLQQPTLIRGNLRLAGFAFSRRVNALPTEARWSFYALRWLAIIGVIYVLSAVVAMLIMFY